MGRELGARDLEWLDGKNPDALRPLDYIGKNRLPILFNDIETMRSGLPLEWPERFDLHMICDETGVDFTGSVISQFSL
jgi:hypothetical protein